MALRVYLVPKAGDGVTVAFHPQHIGEGGIAGSWRAIDYGKEPWMLVVANVTNAEHASIAANADVTAVPANLDQSITGQLATVQGKLELANIPGDWVTSGMSYRTMLKWVFRILLLMQRFRGFDSAANRFFDAGLTLDSTVGDIPTNPRQRLMAAAESLGLDISGITLSSPVRSALRTLGQQMTFPVVVRFRSLGQQVDF